MNMMIHITGWMLFCVAVALLSVTALLMQWMGGFLITKDVLVRDFTILDLELASKEIEIDNTIKGITQLEPDISAKVIRFLKGMLYADFLFMPAAYGGIFIACMKVAYKMPESGQIYFSILGWLQAAAWISDIIENLYLLKKIGRRGEAGKALLPFVLYQWLEVVKWGLSLLGVVGTLSALMYFWISGLYMAESLGYLLAIAVELIAFVLLMQMLRKPGNAWKAAVHA